MCFPEKISVRGHAFALLYRALSLFETPCGCDVFSSSTLPLTQTSQFFVCLAMDARTAKRVGDILYVRSQPYFRNDYASLEPDPFEANISTRYWKWAVRTWTTALMQAHRKEHQGACHEVSLAAVSGGA